MACSSRLNLQTNWARSSIGMLSQNSASASASASCSPCRNTRTEALDRAAFLSSASFGMSRQCTTWRAGLLTKAESSRQARAPRVPAWAAAQLTRRRSGCQAVRTPRLAGGLRARRSCCGLRQCHGARRACPALPWTHETDARVRARCGRSRSLPGRSQQSCSSDRRP